MTDTRIGVLASLECPPGRRTDVLAAVHDLAAASADEPGTLLFEVFTERDDEDLVTVYEIYADDAAVEAHRGSPAMERFREALVAIGVRPRIRWLRPA